MASRSDAANAGGSGSAASTTTAASTSSRDDGGSSNIVDTVVDAATDFVSEVAAAPGNISRDLQMGLGIIPKDQDYIDRTAATIERTQGSDAASRYASGQTDNGFQDNYNTPASAPATQTDFSGSETFGEAFAAARDTLGPGQTFTYDGASYSTAITGEDPALDAAIASQGAAGAAGAGSAAINQVALDNQSAAEEAMGLSTSVGFPDTAPASVIATGGPGTFTPGALPAGDPDSLDPRGNQIESPTGTGIGQPTVVTTDENDNVVTLSGNIPQDLLDQIGGAAGTTIEDLLPSNATAGVGLDNMNLQERLNLQEEMAERDPTGQSTATGVQLSDDFLSMSGGDVTPGTISGGSTIDVQVVDTPDGLQTVQAINQPGMETQFSTVKYTDAQGNEFNTLAEAQLSDAQELNRQLTGIQNIPTQSDYIAPAQPQVIQAGLSLPSLSDIGSGLSTAFNTITGAISDFDQGRKSADQINRENQAAYEREAFGPFGRDPETGQATPFETLPDGTMIRQGANPMAGLGITGVGLQDLEGLIGSGLYSAGEFFGKPTVTEREGQPDLIGPAEDNFLKRAGTTMMERADILGNRAFQDLDAGTQANLSNPVFPEGGGIDLPALGSKVVRTLPSAGAALTNPLIAGGLTVGDVGMSSDDAIESAVADGTLADLSQAEVQTLKDEARRTNTIPAALIGTISNLLPGRLGQNLLQRMGISAAEEFVQEGAFEPNIAQNTANMAMGIGPEFVFDPEAGTVGAVASGGASVATRGTAPNQAGGAGPNVGTTGPVQPASPAAGVISGQALTTPTQVDVSPTIQQPTAVQPVSPEQVPSVINIPGTDVVVQSVAPAQPPVQTDAAPSGLAALGTGGAFQLPTTGNVPQLPAPSNVDAQPSVPEIDVSQINRPNVDPEALTAAEILQNEIDIITTDTNTSADEASRGPASIALIEAAQNEGADVNVGDTRADVAGKIANQVALDNQAAAEAAMGRTGGISSAVPKAQMNDDAVASLSQGTVTQSAADLLNNPNRTQQEILDVARENGIVAGPGTGILPIDVITELTGRVNDPSLTVVDSSQVASDNQLSAEEAMGRVDISRINQPAGIPEGIGSLDAAVEAARQNLSPEGIINLEVAQTGDLSLETARKVAEDNNLSMQEVTNMGERAKGLEESKATGPSTEVDVAATVDVVDATPSANQLAAEEAMGRGTTEFVFDGEVLSPTDTEVSTEVETPAEGQTIEGTVGSRDVATVVDVPVDTSTTTPTDTTTTTPTTTTTTTPETIRAVRSTDTAPRDENEVEVEVEDPETGGPGVTTGDPEEEEVEVKIDTPDDDDDDDDDTAEDAPFECPEGFEAVQIDGEWRCQKIGDDTPKIGRMRPTGGSYYQPRRPSPATTAKAYRFR